MEIKLHGDGETWTMISIRNMQETSRKHGTARTSLHSSNSNLDLVLVKPWKHGIASSLLQPDSVYQSSCLSGYHSSSHIRRLRWSASDIE